MIRGLALMVVTAGVLLSGATASASCDADTFVSQFALLKKPYGKDSWLARYPEYRRPERDIGTIDEQEANLLREVFEIAPKFFQERLCKVTLRFVDESGPWAFHERVWHFAPGQNSLQFQKYLTIPVGAPPSLAAYETLITQSLSKTKDIRVEVDGDSRMGLLSALAHEDGHLLFRELYGIFAMKADDPFDSSRFCDGSYFSRTWKEPIEFKGDSRNDGIKSEHLHGPQAKDVLGRSDRVWELLKTKQWTTFWASLSPEHDWVETYKIFVLANTVNPPKTMVIVTPTGTIDLLAHIADDSDIARKFNCFKAR